MRNFIYKEEEEAAGRSFVLTVGAVLIFITILTALVALDRHISANAYNQQQTDIANNIRGM